MHHPTDRIAYTLAFVKSDVEHCLEWGIGQHFALLTVDFSILIMYLGWTVPQNWFSSRVLYWPLYGGGIITHHCDSLSLLLRYMSIFLVICFYESKCRFYAYRLSLKQLSKSPLLQTESTQHISELKVVAYRRRMMDILSKHFVAISFEKSWC